MKIQIHFLTQLTPISNTNVVNMCQIIVLLNDNIGEKFYIDSILCRKQVCFDIHI